MSDIVFTKAFAGKKIGDSIKVDGMRASQLIREGVAVLAENYKPTKKKATKE